MRKVRTRHAFLWTCPDCEKVNSVAAEVTPVVDDKIKRRILQLEPWQEIPEGADVEGTMLPDEAACGNCASHVALQLPEDWITDPEDED